MHVLLYIFYTIWGKYGAQVAILQIHTDHKSYPLDADLNQTLAITTLGFGC